MKPFDQLTPRGRARRLRNVVIAALADYALDVTHIRLITNEYNGIFRLDTTGGEKVIMRVCRADKGPEHLRQLRSEMMWLDALARDTDSRVPHPVKTRDGAFTTTVSVEGVPEPRHCVIFSWLPGTDLERQLTPVNVERFGALSARLHQHAATWTPPPDFAVYRHDTPFPFPEPIAYLDMQHRDVMPPARRTLFEGVVTRQADLINTWQANNIPMRVMHGDLHHWNVKVYRGQIAAFDFEEVMLGWPVQDIATTLYYFHGRRDYADLCAAFQRGYTQIAPWPEQSPGEIDLFIAGRGIVLSNGLLTEVDPEWRAEAPAYFAHTEKRIRALLSGEDFFDAYW